MRRRSLFISLFVFLVPVLLINVNATAQIRADANAPADQRPTILQAGNGVPLVNIQTPSAAGISRNTYSQFDVNRNGAILNNSRTDTPTQLGGWVQGNPWLATGSARVILNEVNSTHPSHLNGWIEVAGSRAQVITANPAGITCDGCGFMNTPQATLTTGTPVLNRGNLDSYRIQGGQVQIEGLGLDGRQADALTILSRSAEINAGIWAKRLQMVTGTNDVTVDAKGQPVDIKPIIISPFPQNLSGNPSGSQTKDKATPAFALDVGYLGGMYAGHIFLVGSEHGLGVRNSGTLFAGQQLTLDSNGILSVKDKGKITAPELAIKTEGAIDNSGVIAAQRSATIDTSGTLANTGTIASQQGLSITAQALTIGSNALPSAKGNITAAELRLKTEGAIDNAGEIIAQRSAAIETNSALTNTGTIASQQGLSITAQALTNTGNSTTNASGLIDGQTVFINGTRIDNRGAARLYGDNLILQADTLVNAGETINDITHSPVIAARHHLAMGVGTLENRDGGLIFSGGDLTVGRNLQSTIDPTTGDTHYTTTGFANRINNDSATIEVLGDVFIQAIALANRNTHLQITKFPEAPFVVERVQPAGSNAMYLASQCKHPLYIFGASFFLLCSADGRQESFEDYTLYTLTGTPSRSQVVGSQPAVFRVGGNFRLNGDGSASSQLTNQDSQMVAGGDIHLSGTALNNQETKGRYQVRYSGTAEYTTVEWCGSWPSESHCRKWHGQFAYQSAPEVTTIDLPTGHRYAGNLNQSSGSGGNASTQLPTSLTTQLPTSPPAIPPIPIPALPGSANGANSANSALFTLTANPHSTSGYLIETDPRFARYRQWISSDYLLAQLALDPATTQKRLGDGYYEQSVIRDQVTQMTGRRYLPGYTDDEAQYLALMSNAATVAKELHLRPGIALSAEQVAALTSDIVWLVVQTVTLPDGSTTEVLVPKVYARIKEGDLQADGSLISGRSITARLKGDLTNSGLIAADQNVVLTAENIHNVKGSIDGRDVRVYADVDINHLGGRIAAVDRLKLQAGRDPKVQSTTQTTETAPSASEAARGNRFTRTQVDRVAGIYVTGADSTQSTTTANANTNTASAADNILNLTAGRNVTLSAAQIQNTTAGTTTITTGEHLQVTTVTTGYDDKAVKDANNHSHIAHREDVGTQITTNGALQLSAAQDLTLRAATVTSGGAIEAKAGNHLHIEAGQATDLNDQARKTTHRGTLSRTTTTTRDRFDDNTSVSTTLSGNSINATAANDITVQGSNVVADNDIQLNAGRDLNIVASTNTHAEDHYRHKAKSGVFSSGGVGVTIGKRTQSTDQQTTRTSSSASTVGSLDGHVDLRAGRTYTQTGSDVIALGQSINGNNSNNSPTNTPIQTSGDITITAQQVSITEARETSRTDTQTQVKQSGVTVAVSAPVITAAQTVEQMGQAAGNTSDPRMKALAAANAAMAVNQAADAIQKNPDQLGGVNLSISVGSSKAQSQSTSTTDTSAPSHLTAANNLSVKATKEEITVQGSQLKAGNTVTLQAEQQLKLQAARDSAEQHSTNSNQSASVGVGFALGAKQTGVSLNLTASQGRGKADGSDVAWVNTEVAAGQQIKTESGSDTTIRGGVLTAPRVSVTTGTNGQGDLTIESLQDTSQYKSKQEQQGATLSIPVTGAGRVSGSANATNSNIESDYASVKQQSGIRAGDEGFQVKVNGETTLTGGAITSTQAAVDTNKNTFHTQGTLTTTDITNKAVYEAKSVGVNLGAGFSPSGQLAPQGTGVGLGKDGDNQRSTTQAAISDIAANKAARTGDTETGLTNRFDAERVQQDINAQTQITQIFGTYAAKAVGDYAQLQINQARNLQAEAKQLGTNPQDQPRAQQLLTEAQQIEAQWGEGGSYRLALHTATAGLSGGLSGALGGAATATTAPLLNDLQTSLSKTLKQAGASDAVADGIAQSISTLTATGIGASVGVASGNGLAGAATALNVDANNRQLHPTEIQWIKQNAQRFAKQQGISEEEAEKRLSQQANRQVQAGAAAPEDSAAREFLKQAGRQLLPADPATPGLGVGYLFFATPEQKNNPLMYVDSLIVYADFYRKNDIRIPSGEQIAIAAAKDSQQRDRVAQLTVGSTAVSGLVALAGTAPALAGWILSNPDKAIQTGLITAETGAAIASGAITPSSVTEGLTSGISRPLTAAEQAALREFNAVLRGVGQQKILAQQEQRLNELVQVFKPGSSVNELTMAGERVMLQNTNSSGTTKLFNTSALSDVELQRRVFDYAGELSGGLSLTPHQTSAGIWHSKLPDGSTINVRNVSTSGVGRWTIDIQGNFWLRKINSNYKDNFYEIKFK